MLSAALLLAAAVLPAKLQLPENTWRVVARVEVDASGAISTVAFRQKLKPVLENYLRARIAPWRFEPAQRAGRAVPSSTSLTLSLQPAPDSKGILLMGVDAGPALLTAQEPLYMENHADAGYFGRVVVKCRVNARRRCVDASVAQASARGPLPENLLKAIRKWSFEPDRIDGEAVETWVEVALCFKASRGQEADCEAPQTQPAILVSDVVRLRAETVSLP
jgi:TonB family protein